MGRNMNDEVTAMAIINPGTMSLSQTGGKSLYLRPYQLQMYDRYFGTCNKADITSFGQGAISAQGENLDDSPYNTNYIRSKDFIPVKASQTYTVYIQCNNATQKRCNWFEYDAKGDFLAYRGIDLTMDSLGNGYLTFSLIGGSNTSYIRLQFNNMSGTSATTTSLREFPSIQLERGSSYSPFQPYCLDNAELSNRKLQEFESRNLCDIKGLQQGGINGSTDGSEFDSNIRVRTDFCHIEPNTPYHASVHGSVNIIGGCFFNEAKARIANLTLSNSGKSIGFISPANAHYIRLVIGNQTSSSSDVSVSDVTKIQLERGNTATPFTDYGHDVTDLTEMSRIVRKLTLVANIAYSFKITEQPPTYCRFKLFGYLGGYGAPSLDLKVIAGQLTVIDNETNQSWSNSHLVITYSQAKSTITLKCDYASVLFLIGA